MRAARLLSAGSAAAYSLFPLLQQIEPRTLLARGERSSAA